MRGLGFPHLPLGPPGGQAPFPQRGWRDPPPHMSQHRERRTRENRTAQPRAERPRRARGQCSEGGVPKLPAAGEPGRFRSEATGFRGRRPRCEARLGQEGRRARQGRLRGSRTSAGVPLVAKRLPARQRPSSEAFLSGRFSQDPRPSPRIGLRSRVGGEVLSHQTR